jgi:hypothetical protein
VNAAEAVAADFRKVRRVFDSVRRMGVLPVLGVSTTPISITGDDGPGPGAVDRWTGGFTLAQSVGLMR